MKTVTRWCLATLVLLVSACGLAAMASAHTTVTTSDGNYFITVGNLNEPITTFTKTGLDLIIRANNSGVRGAGIPGVHLTLQAYLTSPNGKEFTQPLRAQFGAVGSYSFTDPYVLTQAGTYYLRVSGMINQTPVDIDKIVVGSGPVPAIEEHFFPDNLSSPKQLEDRIKALESKNTQLQAQLDSLKQQGTTGAKGNSPAFDAVGLLALLAIAGVALRRSRGPSP